MTIKDEPVYSSITSVIMTVLLGIFISLMLVTSITFGKSNDDVTFFDTFILVLKAIKITITNLIT